MFGTVYSTSISAPTAPESLFRCCQAPRAAIVARFPQVHCHLPSLGPRSQIKQPIYTELTQDQQVRRILTQQRHHEGPCSAPTPGSLLYSTVQHAKSVSAADLCMTREHCKPGVQTQQAAFFCALLLTSSVALHARPHGWHITVNLKPHLSIVKPLRYTSKE